MVTDPKGKYMTVIKSAHSFREQPAEDVEHIAMRIVMVCGKIKYKEELLKS